MGKYLLDEMGIELSQLDHLAFEQAKSLFEKKSEDFYHWAVAMIDEAIKRLYGTGKVSWQRLAATFRRGDLLEELQNTKESP